MTAAAPTSSVPSAAWHGVHRSESTPPASSRCSLAPERRGRLKNGNRPGDFLAAPRCGARTRCDGECRQPLQQLASALGIDARVRFAGRIDMDAAGQAAIDG